MIVLAVFNVFAMIVVQSMSIRGFSIPHNDCIDSRYGSIVFLSLVSSASNTVALWDEGFSLTVFGSLSTSSSLGIRDLYSFPGVSLRVGGFS